MDPHAPRHRSWSPDRPWRGGPNVEQTCEKAIHPTSRSGLVRFEPLTAIGLHVATNAYDCLAWEFSISETRRAHATRFERCPTRPADVVDLTTTWSAWVAYGPLSLTGLVGFVPGPRFPSVPADPKCVRLRTV